MRRRPIDRDIQVLLAYYLVMGLIVVFMSAAFIWGSQYTP